MFTIQFTIALDTPMQIQCIAGVLLIIKPACHGDEAIGLDLKARD